MSEDLVKGSVYAPITLNQYAYCWNQPLDLIDLDGLRPYANLPTMTVDGQGNIVITAKPPAAPGIYHSISVSIPASAGISAGDITLQPGGFTVNDGSGQSTTINWGNDPNGITSTTQLPETPFQQTTVISPTNVAVEMGISFGNHIVGTGFTANQYGVAHYFSIKTKGDDGWIFTEKIGIYILDSDGNPISPYDDAAEGAINMDRLIQFIIGLGLLSYLPGEIIRDLINNKNCVGDDCGQGGGGRPDNVRDISDALNNIRSETDVAEDILDSLRNRPASFDLGLGEGLIITTGITAVIVAVACKFGVCGLAPQ